MVALGIDTGGTYTDAVLYDEARGVLATAKAPTTRHDLSVGIAAAVDAVLASGGVDPGALELVSLSTTLATNALVEGRGARVALVLIGFDADDAARAGLDKVIGDQPVISIAGGHSPQGDPLTP